jgi:hypothetical protein
MERVVEPELLDQLSPSDPRAVHSRRDLHWINLWMGNLRWINKRFSMLAHPPGRILPLSVPARTQRQITGDSPQNSDR